MATIRKRGTGSSIRYQVQVRRKGHGSVNRSFLLLKDAETWARQTEVQVDRHELPANLSSLRGLTLGDLVARYVDTVSSRKRTASAETVVLRAFSRHPICKRPVRDLRTSDFAVYRDERLKKLKPSSVKRELVPVRHLFEVARKEWGLPLMSNPLAELSQPGADQRRERRLRSDEFRLLLEATKGCRNRLIAPLVVFALATAMRRGEMLAMRWPDIDEVNRCLLIPTSKTGQARTIPLSTSALIVLQQIPRTSERVFPMSGNACRLAWEKLCRRAGIEDLHFHDLRHEAISRFFELGLSVPEVGLISGHRDARMLFRYTHPLRERIAARLDQTPAPALEYFGVSSDDAERRTGLRPVDASATRPDAS